MNPLLRTDSYKFTHWKQYPPGTTRVYSYLESRGGMFDDTVLFGLQYYLNRYLSGTVFSLDDVQRAADFCRDHFGQDDLFNRAGWESLYRKHQGRLPVEIRAVPEGTVVPVRNVLVTIENTDQEFPWLTNYLETLLLKVWYPTTVATLSREIKKVVKRALDRTGTPSLLPFKLHDFGYRGVSSEETAAIGGAAHLVNFLGSDTVAGIVLLQDCYQPSGMPGFSIPASEHSTITSWGEDREGDAYANMLDAYPTGLMACVSDSFDIYAACEKLWGGVLRQRVMERPGTLVVRPDSGDPIVVLDKVFSVLADRFGWECNAKGYKVIAPCVRVIQGDGVNYHTIQNMASQLTRRGWSHDNWGYGMGGALLQQLNRDTQQFAFKCSAIEVNGEWRSVHKHPKTDTAKASKQGKLRLIQAADGAFRTVEHAQTMAFTTEWDLLQTVFRDGAVVTSYTLDAIRERAQV